MTDSTEVINFLQDFECAKLEHLQCIFKEKNYNFKNVLYSNLVSRKGDVFIHNTRKIDEKMLIALDILCKKLKGQWEGYYKGYDPVQITVITKNNIKAHIVVATEENRKGIIKKINSYPRLFENADMFILAFPDVADLNNIDCKIPFLYTTYPNLETINKDG